MSYADRGQRLTLKQVLVRPCHGHVATEFERRFAFHKSANCLEAAGRHGLWQLSVSSCSLHSSAVIFMLVLALLVMLAFACATSSSLLSKHGVEGQMLCHCTVIIQIAAEHMLSVAHALHDRTLQCYAHLATASISIDMNICRVQAYAHT